MFQTKSRQPEGVSRAAIRSPSAPGAAKRAAAQASGLDVRVGHVHLRVADLARATAFYRDVLGFTVTVDGPAIGLQAVFLAAGDYHHHIALNTWLSAGGAPAPAGYTGLHHFALLYPDRPALARAMQRLVEHDYPLDGAADHGGTVSVYLRDPDGNGIELYYDRPREQWFDASGRPIVRNDPFDPRHLLLPEADDA
ncbi:MAG TPA: VOC family protein [Gemmatimonadaceae bacterium]|nr:VOC family protein [Gemmatimonadaceae bacterium]